MAGVEPTEAEKAEAYRLLDELTFGGHSHDGAASALAYAFALHRTAWESQQPHAAELAELRAMKARLEAKISSLGLDERVNHRELRLLTDIEMGD